MPGRVVHEHLREAVGIPGHARTGHSVADQVGLARLWIAPACSAVAVDHGQ